MSRNVHAHPYGGQVTVIGEYTPKDLIDWLLKCGKGLFANALMMSVREAHGSPMKVLDIFEDNREILVYTTTSDYLRLEVINK